MMRTYLAGVTLVQHFEHICGALVPLQIDNNNDFSITKSHSQSVPTVLAKRKFLLTSV